MTVVKIIIYERLPDKLTVIPSNKYICEHISKIKSYDYKLMSTLAYTCFADTLQEATGVNISQISITENEHGKPIITDRDLHFNISHSKNAVMCALSDKSIGVDIEHITQKRDSIIKKCFTDTEAAWVRTDEDFFRIWTLKESYLKATGTGIISPLTRLSFTLGDKIVCHDEQKASTLNFYSGSAYGYAYSVCSHESITPDNIIITKK